MTVLTDNQHYIDIANAIRSKTGGTEKYAPSQMASAIEALGSLGDSLFTYVGDVQFHGAYGRVTFALDIEPWTMYILVPQRTDIKGRLVFISCAESKYGYSTVGTGITQGCASANNYDISSGVTNFVLAGYSNDSKASDDTTFSVYKRSIAV